MERLKAYGEGFDAFSDEKILSDNPYNSFSQSTEYADWRDGWLAAEKEETDKDEGYY